MAYLIERFGDAYATAEELPILGGEQPLGGGGARSGRVGLAGGGSYDVWGNDRAPARAQDVTVTGWWPGASEDAMESKLATLKALEGVRSKLWRSNGVDAQWRWARLMQVEDAASRGTPATDEISLTFEMATGVWNGTPHDDVTTLNVSPKTITVANGGNMRVGDAVVMVTAGSAPITALSIAISGVSKFTYSGTIAVGKSVVIDCGALSVHNDGVDDYEHFALDTNLHTISEWLRLEPGNNSVVVTITGGATDSTIHFQYNDGWA